MARLCVECKHFKIENRTARLGRCALSGRVRGFYDGCGSYRPLRPAAVRSIPAPVAREKTEAPEHVRNPYHKRPYDEWRRR